MKSQKDNTLHKQAEEGELMSSMRHPAPMYKEVKVGGARVFNSKALCKGQRCMLLIDDGSVLNGASPDLVSKLGMIAEPYQVCLG